jgi:hypothetical protein
MEHRSLISSRFCRGQTTGEEVVELANGSSQVVQQRGLRYAFERLSISNKYVAGIKVNINRFFSEGAYQH